jgi:hypothetical protein
MPATPIGPGTWCLDLEFQGYAGAVAAFLLHDGADLVLVETGPGSTLPALEAGVRAAGFALEQLTAVAVTHVHLDHAGAAGAVLARAPRARLHVHPRGVAHMVDPSRLVASAARIYGDRMERLWGAFEPVPADRVAPSTTARACRAARAPSWPSTRPGTPSTTPPSTSPTPATCTPATWPACASAARPTSARRRRRPTSTSTPGARASRGSAPSPRAACC